MKHKTGRRNRRGLIKPVLIGFAVLYSLIMLLATFMVKEQFAASYVDYLTKTQDILRRNIAEQEQAPPDNWEHAEKHDWYQYLVNGLVSLEGDKFRMLSIAVYDEKGRLLAKSANIIRDISGTAFAPLDELLSREDQAVLAGYMAEGKKLRQNSPIFHPPIYKFDFQKNGQSYDVSVYESTWKEEKDLEPDESYVSTYETTSRTDYSGNPDYENEAAVSTWYETERRQIWKCTLTEPDGGFPPSITTPRIYFPYIEAGYKTWEAWNKNEFLHDFPEQIGFSETDYFTTPVGFYRGWPRDFFILNNSVATGTDGDSTRYLQIRMESYPWMAAMNHMKYVYLAGFAMMLACMIKIIYSANKIYDQQEALEETRKDFINAMAHELKTPLGVIRNFAENLQEGHMEEKRDYYLEQIVDQTEEMDRLVEEMILVTKMDSEKLVLQKETLSVEELIREQLSRLESLIAEKNLQVDIQSKGGFLVEGDKDYLEKALWNLLSNAVIYNLQNGTLRIFIEPGICRIENTGGPLSEEQLNHAFDLFYSGDKSRSSHGEKHLGMGLYLAKRILERHRLSLTLENSTLGICATMSAVNPH